MRHLGFYYDMRSCIGCKACQVACKEEHKLATGSFFRRVDICEVWEDAQKDRVAFSGACNHCADPACVKACPTGAMRIAEDGTVLHEDGLCIGCGRCVHSCPYGVPSLNRITGYAQKCDACSARRATGHNPACVDACPTRALKFGDLDELQKAYGAASGKSPSFLPPNTETHPSLVLHSPLEGTSDVRALPAATKKGNAQECFRRDTSERFVVLGGGAAAVSAAKAIRARNRTASIQIISGESRLPYCRPMLSKALLCSFSMDRYPIVEKDWLRENQVELMQGTRVTAIDAKQKTVCLEGAESISYDKCIYALGAECFVPPIAGADKDGVYTVRYDSDVEGLR